MQIYNIENAYYNLTLTFLNKFTIFQLNFMKIKVNLTFTILFLIVYQYSHAHGNPYLKSIFEESTKLSKRLFSSDIHTITKGTSTFISSSGSLKILLSNKKLAEGYTQNLKDFISSINKKNIKLGEKTLENGIEIGIEY